MPRIHACLSALAVSALLSAAASAATPEPQTTAVTLSQSVESGIREAQLRRTNRDYTGAVKILSQLMLVAADDPRVVSEYGKVLVQQGRAREALDFLNRAAQLQENDWTLYSALGVAYDQTGNFDNARSAYERALALSPGEKVILNNYAMSRTLAGDLPEAKRLIAQAAATGKDERIARNVKLINGLTLKAAAHAVPAPHIAAAPVSKPVAGNAPAVLTKALPPLPQQQARTLSAAEGRTVMMQAVPQDTKAGPVAKAKTARKVAATEKKKTPSDGIPSLRLANDRQ